MIRYACILKFNLINIIILINKKNINKKTIMI